MHCKYHVDAKHGFPDPNCRICERVLQRSGLQVNVEVKVTVSQKNETAPAATPPKPFPFNLHPWDDVTQEELDRVRLFHWKYNSDPYWRNNLQRTARDFQRAFPLMQKQCVGWTVPAPKKAVMARIGKIGCSKCHARGWVPQHFPVRGGPPGLTFLADTECECSYEVELNSPQFKAAMEAEYNYHRDILEPPKEIFNTNDLDESR